MVHGVLYKHVHWYVPHYLPRHVRRCAVGVALVAGGVALVVKVVHYLKDRKERQKHERDVVYLYTFQKALQVPNPSPEGLKMETWLRMRQIRHEVQFGVCFHARMAHNPFIVLNGEELHDANFIIERLTEHFHCEEEEDLNDEEKGRSVAVQRMVDNHTGWTIATQSHVYKIRELLRSLGFPFALALLVGFHIRKHFLQASYAHGIGRHSNEEISQLRSEDIRALSRLLGNKEYMMGDKATKVDACVFGHLAQLVYWPNMEFPEMAILQGEARNLLNYLNKMKGEFWPDWEAKCRKA